MKRMNGRKTGRTTRRTAMICAAAALMLLCESSCSVRVLIRPEPTETPVPTIGPPREETPTWMTAQHEQYPEQNASKKYELAVVKPEKIELDNVQEEDPSIWGGAGPVHFYGNMKEISEEPNAGTEAIP